MFRRSAAHHRAGSPLPSTDASGWNRHERSADNVEETTAGPTDSRHRRRLKLFAFIAMSNVVAGALARRRGFAIGMNTIVRCRQGHLFSTIWLPGASVKALRLGPFRFQHCPGVQHWTFVVPVRNATLSEAELRDANAHR